MIGSSPPNDKICDSSLFQLFVTLYTLFIYPSVRKQLRRHLPNSFRKFPCMYIFNKYIFSEKLVTNPSSLTECPTSFSQRPLSNNSIRTSRKSKSKIIHKKTLSNTNLLEGVIRRKIVRSFITRQSSQSYTNLFCKSTMCRWIYLKGLLLEKILRSFITRESSQSYTNMFGKSTTCTEEFTKRVREMSSQPCGEG